MYAYTANSFRYIGDSGDPMPGEQLAEDVPQQVLKAIAIQQAVLRRDTALRASGWALLESGLPPEKVQEWREYRARLVVITDDPNFPDVEWPVEPSV